MRNCWNQFGCLRNHISIHFQLLQSKILIIFFNCFALFCPTNLFYPRLFLNSWAWLSQLDLVALDILAHQPVKATKSAGWSNLSPGSRKAAPQKNAAQRCFCLQNWYDHSWTWAECNFAHFCNFLLCSRSQLCSNISTIHEHLQHSQGTLALRCVWSAILWISREHVLLNCSSLVSIKTPTSLSSFSFRPF